MSFFKSLVLAILATIFLTYVLGSSFMDLLGINVYMDDELVEPLKAISIAALVTVILVVVAIAIVMSVFGTLIFIGLLIGGSLLMVAVGVFWPILLIAGVIYLFTRNKSTQASEQYE